MSRFLDENTKIAIDKFASKQICQVREWTRNAAEPVSIPRKMTKRRTDGIWTGISDNATMRKEEDGRIHCSSAYNPELDGYRYRYLYLSFFATKGSSLVFLSSTILNPRSDQ